MLDRILFKLTHRRWNKIFASVLCRAYEEHVITSGQLHALTAKLDPTQDGKDTVEKWLARQSQMRKMARDYRDQARRMSKCHS